MLGACPWETRAAFASDLNGHRLTQLRNLLSKSIALQARYAALRLESALPKMLHATSPAKASQVRSNFERVATQPLGFYALMDYVNFKGEGINPSERYNGAGWGLLQVLENMNPSAPALPAFARAADEVLTRRVKNSPPPAMRLSGSQAGETDSKTISNEQGRNRCHFRKYCPPTRTQRREPV